jgi:hypothetical protein
MTSARCRNDVSGQVPGEGTARLCPHQAIPTAAEKPLPCLRTRRYCIGGISSNRLSLGITFFRALFEMGLHRLFSVSSAVNYVAPS